MDKDELLERYKALGEDGDFLAAKPLFEAEIRRREQGKPGLRGPEDALLLRQYGYLLQCHGRITIRRAIEQYERSIGLDPGADKVRYQWIGAKASLASRKPRSTCIASGLPPHRARSASCGCCRPRISRHMTATRQPASSPLALSSLPATQG
jgi:hypothetical protein